MSKKTSGKRPSGKGSAGVFLTSVSKQDQTGGQSPEFVLRKCHHSLLLRQIPGGKECRRIDDALDDAIEREAQAEAEGRPLDREVEAEPAAEAAANERAAAIARAALAT
ncbi:MAG: hypothetical protein OXP74_17730 [Acidobacteriota bacterium]|nr:hypothetical protein [Acidobacteriota bacterium]